ncbi:unnamed protein product [Natator depressus]
MIKEYHTFKTYFISCHKVIYKLDHFTHHRNALLRGTHYGITSILCNTVFGNHLRTSRMFSNSKLSGQLEQKKSIIA